MQYVNFCLFADLSREHPLLKSDAPLKRYANSDMSSQLSSARAAQNIPKQAMSEYMLSGPALSSFGLVCRFRGADLSFQAAQ